jgi:hypothetical protein
VLPDDTSIRTYKQDQDGKLQSIFQFGSVDQPTPGPGYALVGGQEGGGGGAQGFAPISIASDFAPPVSKPVEVFACAAARSHDASPGIGYACNGPACGGCPNIGYAGSYARPGNA